MRKELILTMLCLGMAISSYTQPSITIYHYDPATGNLDNGSAWPPFCSTQEYYASVATFGALTNVCSAPVWYDQNNNIIGYGTIVSLTISANISIHASAIVGYPDCSVTQGVTSNTISITPQSPNVLIHGSKQVCVGVETYNLNDIPAGTSIVWSVSSNLQINSGQNTSSLQVQRVGTSTGGGSISASVGSFCSYTPPTLTQAVTLGVIQPTSIGGMTPGQHFNPGFNYTFTSTGTDWQVTNGTISSGQGTNSILVHTALNPGSGVISFGVSVRENDACGTSPYLQWGGYIDPSGGGKGHAIMAPNPASGMITISTLPGETAPASGTTTDETSTAATKRVTAGNKPTISMVKIYDAMGRLRKTIVNGPASAILQLNVGDLGNGVYFLEMQIGGEVERQKLVVQH